VYADVAAQAAKIVRAGGKVGVGAHGQLQGLGYHWELWGLARGMTNYEVLRAATKHGAEMIGVGQDLGTITPGKLADLVILKADPRENIRNSREIDLVVKNGELFDGETLDKRWPEQQSLGVQWWQQLGPVSARKNTQ
jgi:imidazolonepropionase-like amidohydrolase